MPKIIDDTSVIIVSDADIFGGAEVYIKLLIEALPEEFNVQLVARPELEGKFSIQRVRFTYTPLPASQRVWYTFCQSHKTSIFHFNLTHYASCRWYAVVARLAGVERVLGTLHTIIHESRIRHWQPKSIVARNLFRSYTHIISPSQYVADMLIKQRSFPNQRVSVVNNGVIEQAVAPIDRASLDLPNDCFLIVALGRLQKDKGFDYLLRALADLPDSACLALAGDGDMKDELVSLAKDLLIDERVKFLGYRTDRLNILKAADVFVLSSLQHSENFPYVILEAMMLGVPIVATKVGAVSEQIVDGQSGILIEPAVTDSLVAALSLVMSDTIKSRTLAESAKMRYKQKFSLNSSVDHTVRIYIRA